MRHRGIIVGFAGALACVMACTMAASAQDAKAVYQKRSDTMKEIGRNSGAINRAVRGQAPLGPDTTAAATNLDNAAKSLTLASFAPGSDVPGSNMKPEANTDQEKVGKLLADMQAASAKLVTAMNSGDKAAIEAAYGALGGTCGACHKDYRKPLQ